MKNKLIVTESDVKKLKGNYKLSTKEKFVILKQLLSYINTEFIENHSRNIEKEIFNSIINELKITSDQNKKEFAIKYTKNMNKIMRSFHKSKERLEYLKKQKENKLKDITYNLCKMLREDEGLYFAWQSAIAMAFVDEGRRQKSRNSYKKDHAIANQAAKNFIDLLMKQ